MGGGEGMGPVKKTAEALEEALFDKEHGRPIGQMVVICGRNEALAASLRELEWDIPIKVKGFEKQMEKWMAACDCIITKVLRYGYCIVCKSALCLISSILSRLSDYFTNRFVLGNGLGWTWHNCRSVNPRTSHYSQRLHSRPS